MAPETRKSAQKKLSQQASYEDAEEEVLDDTPNQGQARATSSNQSQFTSHRDDSNEKAEVVKKKPSFWKELLAGVDAPTPQPVRCTRLTPDWVLNTSRTLVQVVESVAGVNVNPFLHNSEDGHFTAPDGSEIPLSILSIKKFWPTIRAQKGSIGTQSGLLLTTTRGDKEFFEELLSSARQMEASGAGMCLLFAGLSNPNYDLHGRFKEMILHEVISDWHDFTSWEKWCGLSELEVISNQEGMASDFLIWKHAWNRLTTRLTSIFDRLIPDVDRRLELMEKYSALRKSNFKGAGNLKKHLREESDLALRILTESNGHTMFSWSDRVQVRIKLLHVAFGSSVAPFIHQFETSRDVYEFNEILESMITAMGVVVFANSGTGDEDKNEKSSQQPDKSGQQNFGRPKNTADPVKKEGTQSGTQQGRYQGKCEHCGKYGHAMKDCYKLKPNQNDKTKQVPKDPNPTQAPEGKSIGGFAGFMNDNEFGLKVIKLNTDKGVIRIGVDSGLDLSLLSKNSVCYDSARALPTNLRMESLSGHSVNIKEIQQCCFSIPLNNTSRPIEISAMTGVWTSDLPGKVDVLIGSDVLNQHPAILHAAFPIKDIAITPTDTTVESSDPIPDKDIREMIVNLNLPVMKIDVTQEHPAIRSTGYPVPLNYVSTAQEILDDLTEKKVLKDITAEADRDFGWISPAFFVKKESNELKLRFVVDFRQINTRIPRPINEQGESMESFCLAIPRGMKAFGSLDIKDAFYQIPIEESSRKYLRASIKIGAEERVYEFLRGPQGLNVTPYWWKSFVGEIVRVLRYYWNQKGINGGYRIYVDDVLVYAATPKDCELLLCSFEQMLKALNIPYGKVQRPSDQAQVIGCIVDSSGWRIDPTKLCKLKDTCPTNKDELRSFLGLIQYLHSAFPSVEFSQNFSVLSRLTSKHTHFQWNEGEKFAWKYFCEKFDTGSYDFGITDLSANEYWILQTDASDRGTATVLWRSCRIPPTEVTDLSKWFSEVVNTGECRRLAVRQRTFSSEEQNYPTWDKEGLALFNGMVEFQDVILSSLSCIRDTDSQVYIYSDNTATLGRWKNIMMGGIVPGSTTRVKRWLRWYDDVNELLEVRPKFLHLPGKENGIADYFSRVLCQMADKGIDKGSGEEKIVKGFAGTLTVPDNFDFNHFQLQVGELQRTTDEQYQKLYLRDLLNEIPSDLLSFSNQTGLLHFMNRLYIPQGLIEFQGRTVCARTLLIHICHDPSHPGITRTMSLLQRYWWPRQQMDIERFIRTCHECQVQKARQVHGRITGRHCVDRFQSVTIDHCKPRLVGKGGFEYCLVICDNFTRYVRIYPCKTLKTSEFAEHYLEWCTSFGFPREIYADNHQTFLSEGWKHILKWPKEQTRLLNSPTFYPLAQGIAERHMRVIKACLYSTGHEWPTRVKYIAFTHNLCPLQASSVTPFQLVLGSNPESLADLLSWTTNPNPDATLEEVRQNLVEELAVCRQYQQERVDQLRQYGRDRYNQRHDGDVPEGPVLLIKLGPLGRVVTGPFEIENIEGNMLDLRISEDEVKRVSLSQVISYHKDCEPLNRENLVSHGSPNFDWESLIKIKPENLKKGDMLLVRRIGVPSNSEGDVITLDLGRVIAILEDIRLIEYEIFNQVEGGKWKSTKIKKTASFGEVVVTGFTLTKEKHIRAKNRKVWNELGLFY